MSEVSQSPQERLAHRLGYRQAEAAGPLSEAPGGVCVAGAPDLRVAAAQEAWRLDPYRAEAARQAEADRGTRAEQHERREHIERAAREAAEAALAGAGATR